MALKTRLRGLKMKATSRLKQGKAAIGKFNFTSARKAALKKAQEASARARKLANSSADRQMAVKGAGMKVRSKAKQTAAAARSAVAKVKPRVRSTVKSLKDRAGLSQTAKLRSQMNKQKKSKAKSISRSVKGIKMSAKLGGGSIQKAGQVADFLTKSGVYSQYASPEQKRARQSLTQKKNRSTRKKK